MVTPRRLTPGHAQGVIWEAGPYADAGELATLDAGRAMLVGPVQHFADTPDGPFVWQSSRVDVASLLALRLQGLAGVLLTDPGGIGRHALTLALGLGVPVVLGAPRAPGSHVALGDASGTDCLLAGTPWSLPSGPNLIRVGSLLEKTASVELATGQPEELALLLAQIESGVVDEVGLLRLEHIVALDPGMASTDLSAHLSRILGALRGVPVAVRLSTWAADNPRPPTYGLTASDEIDCLRSAATDARHSGLTVLVRSGQPRPTVAWAPFLEAPEATADPTRPAWIGLGDLGLAAGTPDGLTAAIERIAEGAGGPTRLCGVAADWPGILGPKRARILATDAEVRR